MNYPRVDIYEQRYLSLLDKESMYEQVLNINDKLSQSLDSAEKKLDKINKYCNELKLFDNESIEFKIADDIQKIIKGE